MIFFTKMQGLGNDFIIINCIKQQFNYSLNILSKYLCDRNLSIGADGVIYIFNSKIADYKMRIFNKDGTEAGMCGNGIRCMANYIYENISKKNNLKIETNAGIKQIKINNKNIKEISVNIGKPILDTIKIPVYLPYKNTQNGINNFDIKMDEKNYKFYFISVGNPHSVCFVENIEKINIEKYGPYIENYKFFPNKTNVEFVQVIDKENIKLRVWERGVGETLACGTGASCSAYIATKIFELKKILNVELKGGRLQIEINEKEEIILTGLVENVFEGKINL